MNRKLRELLPFVFLFFFILLLLLPLKEVWNRLRLDTTVLLIANAFFFILTVLVFHFQRNALNNTNPNVFIRSILGGFMIKMLLCLIVVLVYRFAVPYRFSKISVFISMFFYLFYLSVEVVQLMKLNKKINA